MKCGRRKTFRRSDGAGPGGIDVMAGSRSKGLERTTRDRGYDGGKEITGKLLTGLFVTYIRAVCLWSV